LKNAIHWAISQAPNGYATIYTADRSIYRSYRLDQVSIPPHSLPHYAACGRNPFPLGTNDPLMLQHSPLEFQASYREHFSIPPTNPTSPTGPVNSTSPTGPATSPLAPSTPPLGLGPSTPPKKISKKTQKEEESIYRSMFFRMFFVFLAIVILIIAILVGIAVYNRE